MSDHALLRWLERRYGINVEAEREKIDKITRPYRTSAATKVKVDGLQFVFRDGIVVTVLAGWMGTSEQPRA